MEPPYQAHVVLGKNGAPVLGTLGAGTRPLGAPLGARLPGEVLLECSGGLVAVKTPEPAMGPLRALFGVHDAGLATAKATWKAHRSRH